MSASTWSASENASRTRIPDEKFFSVHVGELLEVGEGDDVVHALADLGRAEAEQGAVEHHVLPGCELLLESDTHLEEGRQSPGHRYVARVGAVDPRDALQQRALAAPVGSHDPEELSTLDLEAQLVQRLERPVPLGPEERYCPALERGVAFVRDDERLLDVLDRYRRGDGPATAPASAGNRYVRDSMTRENMACAVIADKAALALRAIMLRTARSPLKPLWAGLYAVIARGVALIVAPRRTRANVYLTGSLASGEPLYGLSDIDLVTVAADEGESRRVRRRYEALCRALPPLRGLIPHFRTYDARSLASILTGSYLVNGLADGRAVFLGADAIGDEGRLARATRSPRYIGLAPRTGPVADLPRRRTRRAGPRPPGSSLHHRWRYTSRACGKGADCIARRSLSGSLRRRRASGCGWPEASGTTVNGRLSSER